jgi:uncharacterized protein
MISRISHSLSISENQVRKTIALLDEGATIPFISRYRKEATGSLDEVQVAAIRDLRDQYVELEKRREAILKSLKELEKLTPELEKAVRGAETLAKLEDMPGAIQLTFQVVVEIEGQERPACVAESVVRRYFQGATQS